MDKSSGVKITWCKLCVDKNNIQKATFLIPARKLPYDLMADGVTIDKSTVGACNECLEGQSEFKKSHKTKIYNPNYARLYKNT